MSSEKTEKAFALFLLMALLFLTAACTSSKPLPEETLPPLPQEAVNKAEKINITFLPADMFPELNRELPYYELIPEIDGMKAVDFFTPVDVVTNDLNVARLGEDERNDILSTIRGKREIIYIKPEETDVIVFYTIYEFNSSEYAEKVLGVYRKNWNKDNITINNITLHIWKGYVTELLKNSPALEAGVIIYHDPAMKKAFLAKGKRALPALSRIRSNLYSMHGETAIGKYFLMMDIKAEHLNIENKSAEIFGNFIRKINITEALSKSAEAEKKEENRYKERINELKNQLNLLFESYLAGNITKEEYLEKQGNITAEIEKLRMAENKRNETANATIIGNESAEST